MSIIIELSARLFEQFSQSYQQMDSQNFLLVIRAHFTLSGQHNNSSKKINMFAILTAEIEREYYSETTKKQERYTFLDCIVGNRN